MSLSGSISSRDLLLIMLIIVLWGLNFLPMIYALEELTPVQLGAARFLLSSLPFLAFVRRPTFPYYWLVLYAATQGFGQFALLFIALDLGMPASIVSLLMQVQVFFTALLAMAFFKERLSRALLLGLLVSGIGLVCFIASVVVEKGVGAVTGVGLVLTLSAALMWSLSNILVKKIHQLGAGYDPLGMVVWSGLVSGFLFVLASVLMGDEGHSDWVLPSAKTLLSLLYLGVVANGFCYWVWSRMLSIYPVSRVAPFSLGVPIVGMLSGVLVLGESVSALQWLGALLVMSALLFVVWPSRL